MNVKINGQEKELRENTTIQQMLDELGFKKERVVVELNGDIPEKDKYDEIEIKDNDKIEVIQFVGGG